MAYDAFISYSHAADGQLAPALQRGLQRLAKPWNRRRALNIFRDETGLSTNPHLWSSVEAALDESDWFILLASPEAAASEWVNKEIEHWLATKPADHILPVLTDGTWTWDSSGRDFTADSTAVPQALRGALSDEPRHLDLRWARDEIDLDLRNSRFRAAVADLAAPLHGVAKDELEGEDIRQHRHTRRLARGAVGLLSLLLVAALVAGGLAVTNARRATREATVANARRLASQAAAQAESAPDLAMLLALEARRLQDSVETRSALLAVVQRTAKLDHFLTRFGPSQVVAGLSADAATVAVSDATGRVRLVEVASRRTVRSFATHQEGPLSVFFSSDGAILATTSPDTTVRLWRVRNGAAVGGVLRGHRYAVTAADFSPDERLLVTEDANGQGVVWDVASGKAVATVPEQLVSAAGFNVAFSPDGQHVAVAGYPTTVFEVPSMRSWALPPRPNLVTDEILAFSADGASLAVANSPDDIVDIWNVATRTIERQLHTAPSTFINELAFARGGSRLAAGMGDGSVTVWDLPSGTAVGPLAAHGEEVEHLRFGPSDLDLLSASRASVAAWSMGRAGGVDARRSLGDAFLRGVDLGPDGKLLAVADDSTRLHLLDPRTLHPLATPIAVAGPETGTATNVAFGVDGRLVAVGSQGSLLRVDVATRAVRGPPLKLADGLVADIAANSRGQLAVGVWLGADNAVLVDWQPWRVVRRVAVDGPGAEPRSGAVGLSPDGRLLALGAANGSVFIEETSGANRSRLIRRPGVRTNTVAFTSDGRLLAAGFSDGRAQIFDARTRRPLGELLVGSSGGVTSVVFSPDGRLLAALGAGGGIVLWDTATRRRIGDELRAHSRTVNSGVFSADGKALYTVSSDGSAIRWNLDAAAWARRACKLAGRNLTRAEWRENIGDESYRQTCAQWPAV